MLYTAKEAHVVMRWCDMSASDIADCLEVSRAKARAIKRTPGRLLMGDIERLALAMGKPESVLIKELLSVQAAASTKCDQPIRHTHIKLTPGRQSHIFESPFEQTRVLFEQSMLVW